MSIYKRVNELVESMAKLASPKNNDFVSSACWPDDIKDTPMNFWDEWHFYNRPIDPTGEYLV